MSTAPPPVGPASTPDWALRHPVLASVLCILVPNALGSVANILYNLLNIAPRLTPAQTELFNRAILAYNAVYAPWEVMFPVSCLLLPGSSGFTLVLLSPGSDRSFSPVHLVPPRRGLRGPTLRCACIAAVVDPRAGVQVLGALSK